jgi:hypothetical protein
VSKIETGGPAFPTVESYKYYTSMGMDLRDWFAGQALTGLNSFTKAGFNYKVIAQAAYEIADAMIAERNKEGV